MILVLDTYVNDIVGFGGGGEKGYYTFMYFLLFLVILTIDSDQLQFVSRSQECFYLGVY